MRELANIPFAREAAVLMAAASTIGPMATAGAAEATPTTRHHDPGKVGQYCIDGYKRFVGYTVFDPFNGDIVVNLHGGICINVKEVVDQPRIPTTENPNGYPSMNTQPDGKHGTFIDRLYPGKPVTAPEDRRFRRQYFEAKRYHIEHSNRRHHRAYRTGHRPGMSGD